LPAWTAFAVVAGKVVAWMSRLARLGRGGVIGGRVSLVLQPGALHELCRGRVTALVTGTNGKTTTTRMLTSAVAGLGAVACNETGANMPDGLVAALARTPSAEHAVLEVDERYLPAVLADVDPAVVVLLNLSRDQLDRVGEVRRTEQAIRAALSSCPATIVANCDDVLVTSAALDAPAPIWVSAGTAWRADSTACPRCGSVVQASGDRWWCGCGLTRPDPQWTLGADSVLRSPDGRRVRLAPGLPGAVNTANAANAVAAAVCLGVPLEDAAAAVGSVTDVDGRYRVVGYRNRTVRTLLAKNPAGWRETLEILPAGETPVVLAVNAREADGRDLSWLWDVPFERLRDRPVVACGERATDLAVRLDYAEVPHQIVRDPLAAITRAAPGPVDVVANYTAFRDLSRRLGHAR
jgi:UDP-N-acetylmuramyl tripeptide synthase